MSKLLIWGTGKVAEAFIKNIEAGEIIGFIESSREKENFLHKPVYTPEEIVEITYDVLVIASSYAEEIMKKCRNLGVNENTIIYLRNYKKITNFNNNLHLIKDVVKEKVYLELEGENQYIILQRMNYDSIQESVLMEFNTEAYQVDYSRYRTFELVADLINENLVEGDVAEVGVNVGTFARVINRKLPDRTFYLFDTFDSFDMEEFRQEVSNGNCEADFLEIFKIANADKVLKEMPYPNKCIIKKGFFPDTAIGLETDFAFVSIDVDFEESIYNSIEYFYPRLKDGGYLFVHDYNNSFLFGVKTAVRRYEEKYGKLKKVPLSDNGGTLIITK